MSGLFLESGREKKNISYMRICSLQNYFGLSDFSFIFGHTIDKERQLFEVTPIALGERRSFTIYSLAIASPTTTTVPV